ncbi:hypothetical protein PVOR_31929 [Paenibacillus vortex V453]|uniref:Uncharacterized protein n=1 Tax=Paenibacillus vortex V453 TaxID=715225 RepID=A0A2R9SLH7_9BACL|nr:hypothetical protein PVOR_31929 [Paenibacillus vortex V453]
MSESKAKKRSKTSGWKLAVRIMIPVLLILALFGGMVFGYVVLGSSRSSVKCLNGARGSMFLI